MATSSHTANSPVSFSSKRNGSRLLERCTQTGGGACDNEGTGTAPREGSRAAVPEGQVAARPRRRPRISQTERCQPHLRPVHTTLPSSESSLFTGHFCTQHFSIPSRISWPLINAGSYSWSSGGRPCPLPSSRE